MVCNAELEREECIRLSGSVFSISSITCCEMEYEDRVCMGIRHVK